MYRNEADVNVPNNFISSLRVLFEILDEKKSGYVRLQDIELRWNEEGVKGLPFGVVDALKNVAPPNGCLTFDRFVSGLKLALLSNSRQKNKTSASGYKLEREQQLVDAGIYDRPSRHNEDRISGIYDAVPFRQNTKQSAAPVTVAVKPNNALTTNRRSGSHQVINDRSANDIIDNHIIPPTRPPRPPQYKQDDGPPIIPPRDMRRADPAFKEYKAQYREVIPTRSSEAIRQYKSEPHLTDGHRTNPSKRYSDVDEIYANITQFQRKQREDEVQRRVTVQRKNSGRRHTLTSGIDHNMVVRLQQLEQEKTLLVQGQKMLDEAKEWYKKQFAQIQEKQKYAGKIPFNNNSLEAHREKINFLKARILEVNQNLRTLIESSEKGFPLHMNLALGLSSKRPKDNATQMVKEQNRLLTNEVSSKDKRISVLEQEKSSLIRELFEARSGGKTNYDDTTFM